MKLTGVLTVAVLLAALSGCADELDPIPNPLAQSPTCGGPDVTVCVDAASGSDSGAGTPDDPYKTITRGLQGVVGGDVVQVLPGFYDDLMHGEMLPLIVPPGVTLRGDPPNRGMGATWTEIFGNAPPGPLAPEEPAVVLRDGSTVSGFRIANGGPGGVDYAAGMGESNASFLSNTVQASANGLLVTTGAANLLISDNELSGIQAFPSSVGIRFLNGGMNSAVENNMIVNNRTGVEFASPGGDLGGGPAASAGGNTLSCNTGNDLAVIVTITVDAANNFWDHSMLTSEGGPTGMGIDILNLAMASINATGISVVSMPCP